MAVLRMRRHHWRYVATAALLMLGLAGKVAWHSEPVDRPQPSAGCLRILRLSSSLLGSVDQYADSAPLACLSGSLSAGRARACLRRRMARLRRPARIVLVGDSRSRILQHQLQMFLHLSNSTEPEDVREQDVPPGPLHEFQLATTRDMCRKHDKFCSRLASSELLHVDYWRRPYLHTLFTSKLWSLVDECRSNAHACPDIVVLNSGLWYLRVPMKLLAMAREPMTGELVMRQHVRALRHVLTELARHVTLVWRLEEAVTSDALTLDRKEKFQKKLSASHALFYDIQRQVPGLHVWSSMLPETFDYAQRVCRPLKSVSSSTDAVMEEIFDQCDDEIHVGPDMRQRFVSKLLDILCEEDGYRGPGHCCRG